PPPRPRARDLPPRGAADRLRAARVRGAPHRDGPRRLPARGAAEDRVRADRGEPAAARRSGSRVGAGACRGGRAAQGAPAAPPRTGAICPAARGGRAEMNSDSRPGVRRGRTRLFLLLLTVWALVVVARLAQIQIAEGSHYRAKARRQQERR